MHREVAVKPNPGQFRALRGEASSLPRAIAVAIVVAIAIARASSSEWGQLIRASPIWPDTHAHSSQGLWTGRPLVGSFAHSSSSSANAPDCFSTASALPAASFLPGGSQIITFILIKSSYKGIRFIRRYPHIYHLNISAWRFLLSCLYIFVCILLKYPISPFQE